MAACTSGSTRGLTEKAAPTPDGRIAQLAGMFDFEKDAATGDGWYTVKDPIAGSRVRKRIEPVISSSGTIYLRSVYREDDWIFHDQIEARVGDRVLETDRIPASDRRNTRRVTQKATESRGSRSGDKRYIAESILFSGGADNGILQAIAADPTQPVVLRFVGRELSYTQTMSDDDKKRIAAGVELARLLRAKRGTSTTP
jgi:hypothetical protein